MDNLKRYQIYHDLITFFAILIFQKKSYLGLIFRNGGSIIYKFNITTDISTHTQWTYVPMNDNVVISSLMRIKNQKEA